MFKVQLYHYHYKRGLTIGRPIAVKDEPGSDPMRHFTRLLTCEAGRRENIAAKIWPASNPHLARYVYFVK